MINYIRYHFTRLFNNHNKKVTLIPDYISEYVTLFGSRSLGVHTNNSDVDLLLAESDISTIKTVLVQHDHPFLVSRDYYNTIESINFIFNGLTYQITVVKDTSIDSCITTSEVLQTFPSMHLLYSKPLRVDYFERLQRYLSGRSTNLPKPLKDHLTSNYPELLI